jgi:hypothetical protein
VSDMLITRLGHATTLKVRAALKVSDEPAWMLAERYGTSKRRFWKWRQRNSVEDLSLRPNRLQTTLMPAQQAVATALRKTFLIFLDDLLAAVREFLSPNVSRSGLER